GALMDFAARRIRAPELRVAIVASGAPQYEHAAQAAGRRCDKRRCAARIGWYATRFDAAAAVRRLKTEGSEQLLFLGPDREFVELLEEAGKAIDSSWRPSVYAPGALM